jgi:RHS repeat-associated protein
MGMANRSTAAASRLTSAISARYSNVVSRVYDAASRITQEQLTVGATPYNIGYSYDADNRQTHVTYPDGSVVARNFTDRNQLDVVTFNNALVANFNYDNAGRKVAANFGNGITETRTYQADNLNTSINTPGVTAFGYTWDANKRKLTQTETGIPTNNQVYTYDNEDRLTGFNRNNGDNQAWNLSLVGDWNQFNNNGNVENRTHNAVHEITTVDATPLVHDVKGNLTQNKNGQVYAWDIENRLLSATVPANCPEGIAGTHTYTYDALGRRVSKIVGALTTVFISDGLQKICEYENGTLARSYAYGSYVDEPLVMISGANKYYYHGNNLYSVAALTDAAGSVIERYKYDPYGKATILASDGTTVRTSSIVNNPFLYDGYYHDTETGLEFVNARYYASDFGRFIARDPIGYKGGINLYEYVKGKPTLFIDPSGHAPNSICVLECLKRHSSVDISAIINEYYRANSDGSIYWERATENTHAGYYNPLTGNTTIRYSGNCIDDAVSLAHEMRRRLPGGIGGQNSSGHLPIDKDILRLANSSEIGCCDLENGKWTTEFKKWSGRAVPTVERGSAASGVRVGDRVMPFGLWCNEQQAKAGCIPPKYKPGYTLGERCCCECKGAINSDYDPKTPSVMLYYYVPVLTGPTRFPFSGVAISGGTN